MRYDATYWSRLSPLARVVLVPLRLTVLLMLTSCSGGPNETRSDLSARPWPCATTIIDDAKKMSVERAKVLSAQHDLTGEVALGEAYLQGRISRDFGKAAFWMQKAADAGCPPVQTVLGMMYDNGYYLTMDRKKAFSLYKRAADAHDPDGEYSLGILYQLGQGTEKDPAEGFRYFKMAADEGHLAAAQYATARSYGFGTGVDKDYASALDYAQAAALQDYPEAEMMMAAGSENGVASLAKDPVESLKWLILASEGRMEPGSMREVEQAVKYKKSLLTSDQIADANQRVLDFRREHGHASRTRPEDLPGIFNAKH